MIGDTQTKNTKTDLNFKNMKKMKMTIATAIFCSTALAGYTAYEQATMTDVERMIQANIEALTEDDESNNDGSGKFFYEHLSGSPKSCTLYKYMDAEGNYHVSSSSGSAGVSYEKIQVSGIEETCPDEGEGCTVYSCQETN